MFRTRRRRRSWALAAALLALMGSAPTQGDGDGGLGALVAALPADAVPLRMVVKVKLPAARTEWGQKPWRGEDVRVAGLPGLVRAVASVAGFEPLEETASADCPVLSVVLAGADVIQPAAPATGEGMPRPPSLVATVKGELRLEKKGGPAWVVPLQGRASDLLVTEGDALKIESSFDGAISNTDLLPALLRLVEARRRSVVEALVRADSGSSGQWTTMVARAMEAYDPPTVATALAGWLAHDDDGEDDDVDSAVTLLGWLGAPAVDPVLALPRAGGVAYRWRRLDVLRTLSGVVGADPRLEAEFRQAAEDPSALFRIAGMRGLAQSVGVPYAPDLIAALSDPRPAVAGHARVLLEDLSGQELGEDPLKWSAWLRTKQADAGEDAKRRRVDVPLLPFGVRTKKGSGVPGGPGGKAPTDPISRALLDLVRTQRPDGTWAVRDPAFDACETGLTALALLAFQVSGQDATSTGPDGVIMRRALDALLAAQDVDGDGFIGVGAHGTTIGHALATLALLNAWAEAPAPALGRAAQKALDWIAAARNPYFVWRYGMKPGDNDTFNSVVMMLPLVAARTIDRMASAGGFAPPFVIDAEAWDGMKSWVDTMTDPDDGLVGYTSRAKPFIGYTVEPDVTADREPSVTDTAGGVWFRLAEGVDPKKDAVLGKQLVALERRVRSLGGPPYDLVEHWIGGLAVSLLPKDHRVATAWAQAVATKIGQAAADGSLESRSRWSWLGGDALVDALTVLALTAGDLLPPVTASRPDLAAATVDPRATPATRAKALLAWVAQMPDKAAARALAWLGEGDAAKRAAGARALAYRPEAVVKSLPQVMKLFSALPPEARLTITRALASQAAASPAVRDALVTAMGDAVPAVGGAAAAGWPAGVPLTPLARDALIAMLGAADPASAAAALDVLGREKLPAARAAALLGHADPRVRREAAEQMGLADGTAAERLAPLAKPVKDADPSVREAVGRAVGAIGAPEGVSVLKPLLEDADERVGLAAAEAWASLAVRHASVLDALVAALASPDVGTRRRAAEALARVGKPAERATPAIHAAIKAELARAEQRDGRALLALAEARWAVSGDEIAVAGLLQGLLSARDVSVDTAVRGIELAGRLPQAGMQESTLDQLGRFLGGDAAGCAALIAVADLGTRADRFVHWLERITAGPRRRSDVYGFALVALRRARGR